jgi:hypothetical protein
MYTCNMSKHYCIVQQTVEAGEGRLCHGDPAKPYIGRHLQFQADLSLARDAEGCRYRLE